MWLFIQKYLLNSCSLLCVVFNYKSASHTKSCPCVLLPSSLKARGSHLLWESETADPKLHKNSFCFLPFFRVRCFCKEVLFFFFFSFIRIILAASLPFRCYSIFRHSWDDAPNSQCLWLGTKEAVSLATTTPERSQNSTSTCLRFLFNLGACTSALHGELGSVLGLYS